MLMDCLPITKTIVLKGMGCPMYCYMYGTEGRQYQSPMWADLAERFGCIGYVRTGASGGKDHILFMPKTAARKVGLPTCSSNDRLDVTLVITCLYVCAEERRKGVASFFLDKTMTFCRAHGFTRIEANVGLQMPGKQTIEKLSIAPFTKKGFSVDACSLKHGPDAGAFFEGNVMVFCDIEKSARA